MVEHLTFLRLSGSTLCVVPHDKRQKVGKHGLQSKQECQRAENLVLGSCAQAACHRVRMQVTIQRMPETKRRHCRFTKCDSSLVMQNLGHGKEVRAVAGDIIERIKQNTWSVYYVETPRKQHFLQIKS